MAEEAENTNEFEISLTPSFQQPTKEVIYDPFHIALLNKIGLLHTSAIP